MRRRSSFLSRGHPAEPAAYEGLAREQIHAQTPVQASHRRISAQPIAGAACSTFRPSGHPSDYPDKKK
ncbi:MAG: hypothetical protein IH851_10320 [Armatimonadetes bacterium]|nr:hypothetical protein [Armatimonadota bacterium]